MIKVLQNAYVVYDPKGEISLRQQGVEQAGNYAISTDIGKLDGSVARSTTKQIKELLACLHWSKREDRPAGGFNG